MTDVVKDASTRRRVLLVDDDRDIARGARVRLEAKGFDVVTAYDGQEGLERAILDPPDAIVLDLLMPKKDGLSMLADLREREDTRDVPVVVLTAGGVETNRARANALGARYFISKPHDSERLVRVLCALVGKDPTS